MLPVAQEQYDEIFKEFIALSNLALNAHKKAFEGYMIKDTAMLDEVRESLSLIDDMANNIDDKIVKFLALYDAEANILREVIGVLKATSEVLSIANSAKSFSRKIKDFIIDGFDFKSINEYIYHIHISSMKAYEGAISMMKGINLDETYQSVLIEESKTDDLFVILQKEMLSNICENKTYAIDTVKLVHLLRKFERIADHSVSIGKIMLFAKKGGKIEAY